MSDQLPLFPGPTELRPVSAENLGMKKIRAERILAKIRQAGTREYQTIHETEYYALVWHVVNCIFNHDHPGFRPLDCAYSVMYGGRFVTVESDIAYRREFAWGGKIPKPSLPPGFEELTGMKKKPASSVPIVTAAKAGAR